MLLPRIYEYMRGKATGITLRHDGTDNNYGWDVQQKKHRLRQWTIPGTRQKLAQVYPALVKKHPTEF